MNYWLHLLVKKTSHITRQLISNFSQTVVSLVSKLEISGKKIWEDNWGKMKIIQINSIQREKTGFPFLSLLCHVCRHSLNRFYIRERGTPSKRKVRYSVYVLVCLDWYCQRQQQWHQQNHWSSNGHQRRRRWQAGEEASASKTKQGVPKQCFAKVARQTREKRKKESPFFNRQLSLHKSSCC